jgi:Hemerythrin HHE cation binding domain
MGTIVEAEGTMSPSEVRDHVGRQHIQLRILFVEVEGACREVLEGGRGDPRPAVQKLVHAVWDHIAMEDRLLVPTLRQVDSWGPARAEHVAEEHEKQRGQLTALRDLAKHGPGDEAARATLALIGELITDMDGEEKDLLHPDLLRDDVIAIDQSDG